MKKIARLFTSRILILAIALGTLNSCTKNAQNPSGGGATGSGGSGGSGGGGGTTTPSPTPTLGTPSPLPISDIVTVGSWKIGSYVEQTENSTKKFSNYTFTFLSNNTLIAKNGGTAITGTWIAAEAVFYYGIPVYGSNPNGFFITLGSDLPLSLLGKNFFVSFKGLSAFELESINPAEDTHVIFTK
jgi:hypothetical protein